MSEICHKIQSWHNSDSFQFLKLMLFWHIFYFWYISETFLILVWHIFDIILNLTHFWHFSDTFWTDFWQFYVTDCFLTDFRPFSDTFLKLLGPTLSKSTDAFTSHPDRLNMQFPSHLSRASVYLSFASSESVMRVGEILDYEIPWLWGIGIVMDFNNIRSVVADILFCVAWTVWHNWVNHGNGIRGRTGSTDWAYSYSLSDYKPFCLTQ